MTGQERSPFEAAVAYARYGWPVLPIIQGEKTPVTKHGCNEATTDLGQIADWWRRNPGRNVAIATGAPGPDVLDVDVHTGGSGYPAFNRLKREGLVGEPRAVVRTPSGGMHLYFAGTDQRNGHIPAAHIDYRARGGYVVAPPSTVGGRPYELVSHQPSTDTFDWDAARRFLDPQPTRRPGRERQRDDPSDITGLVEWVARREPGDRNFALYWAAKQAAPAGLLDDAAVERFVDASLRSGLRGGEREARRTIASALRGAERPFARQADAEAGA